MDYEVIFSRRRTLSISVTREQKIIVRAPLRTSRRRIEEFLQKCTPWIEKKLFQIRETPCVPLYSDADIPSLKKKTQEIVLERVEYFSALMGVHPSRVSVNSAKKRFGSCSSEGNINFSFRLCLYPPEVIDYIVVHELAHMIELNHSPRFWNIVEKYIPNYRQIKSRFR